MEIINMWKETRMVVLTALTAAVYAALLIPFKGIQIIPGITEFRPAAVVPIVFGILFGPAGAWGSAIGNVIGDFFGTFGIGSIFGFFGNFFFSLTAYKIWSGFGKELSIKSRSDWGIFVLAVIVSSITCGFIIAWGLEVLKLLPFTALGSIIPINNSVAGIILGPPVFLLLSHRVKKWGIYWKDILHPAEKKREVKAIGILLLLLSILGGWISGLLISSGKYNNILFAFKGVKGEPTITMGLIPFLLIYLISLCFL
ncbi:MAG TPA: QueT transporter family protein [bacterium]|nr:QueT transporter family protein [bacterium]HEX68282.1 QueT transporter family protein [bacterium]